MATYSKRKKTSSKYDHKELSKKLRFALLGIFAFIFLALIAVNFFGPQIGALFGFISVNRNAEGPKAKVTLSTPSFAELPDATNEEEITIEGYAQKGTNVKIFVNGPEKGETLVGDDGKFVFENIPLIEGRNTLFAKSFQNDNESEKSETRVITVDKDKPKIKIEKPKDGDTIKNLNERVLVKGSVNEKAKVRINDRLAVLKPNLSFEFLLGVDEGDVVITVEAIDEAGNSEITKVGVTYKKESN
ncbi:hypothetical protein ACFLZK_01235 [Patescibacteria group bacterium]